MLIFWSSILSVIFALVAGSYAIILAYQLKNKFDSEGLNSFFYYLVLNFIFGLYGILGNHLIQKILLKFEPDFAAVKLIYVFLPFLGIPFLIMAWYLLIRTATGFLGKNLPQHIAIIYFFLSTCAFLVYGLYLKSMTELVNPDPTNLSKMVQLIYAGTDLIIAVCIAFFLSVSRKNRIYDKTNSVLLKFALILIFVSIFRAISLYFSDDYFIARVYFLLLYFGGVLPLVFIVKQNASRLFTEDKNIITGTEFLFEKYLITKREKEIITEICKGKTNKEIADSLFITLQTVKDHTHNIFQKVKVKNRVQLVQVFSKIK